MEQFKPLWGEGQLGFVEIPIGTTDSSGYNHLNLLEIWPETTFALWTGDCKVIAVDLPSY